MELAQHLTLARRITHILDNGFKIGPFRFGLDPIIGIFPVIGDFIPAIASGYIIILAISQKLPGHLITKMLTTLVIDVVVGSIPIVGDVIDFFHKAHARNLRVLEDYLAKKK
jgi:hypothetical protein